MSKAQRDLLFYTFLAILAYLLLLLMARTLTT